MMWNELSLGLSYPSRFLTVLAILAVNAAITLAAWTPPEPKPPIDWSVGPFFGPEQVSAWVASLDTPLMFPGRVRAHRVWVLLTSCAVAAMLLRYAKPPSTIGKQQILRGFTTVRPEFSAVFSATLLAVALLTIGAATLSTLTKTPDLSHLGRSELHVTLSHYDLLAPADRLAAGDRLGIDVIPAYGVLWPVFCGAYQRWFGLCSLGSIIKIFIVINAAGISLFTLSMYRWARGCWLCWTPPIALAGGYYLTFRTFLIPPNHCLIRTGALVIAPIAWSLASRLDTFPGSMVLGVLSAGSLAANFEVGFAVTIGSLATAAFQWAFPLSRRTWLPANTVSIACGLFTGAAVTMLTVALFSFVAIGQHIPLLDVILPSRYAAAGSGAYLTAPPHRWVVPLLCVMLVHTTGTLLLTSAIPLRSRRHSVRAGVCVALLIWIAYPVNRPHTEYLYSTYFLYGFLVVDTIRSLRCAGLSVLKKGIAGLPLPVPICVSAAIALLFGGLWFCMRLDVAHRGGDRWEAPMARHRSNAELLSGVLLSSASHEAENQRAAFIATKARERGSRIVFISSDAFLISRIADAVPAQPFSDPVLCITRSMYEDYVKRIKTLASAEFYMDTRNTTRATWYGFVNDMLRQDFGPEFEFAGTDSGWEIWRKCD